MDAEMGDRIMVDDLFCAEFMKEHTEYDSLLSFLAAGFDVASLADFDAIPDAEFEQYVAKSTDFDSWEEMLKEANKYFIKKQTEK